MHVKYLATAVLVGTLALPAGAYAAQAPGACPPKPWTPARLKALKSKQWLLEDDAARNALALALQSCLASPLPVLRDAVAFEALSAWMRAKALSTDTLRSILQTQLHIVRKTLASSPLARAGFAQPFAALTLSEVARADRVQAFMEPQERTELVATASIYLQDLRDYRGFNDRHGWRHGIAHSADLMMQLALNPAITRSDMETLLKALASQSHAHNGHAYVFGEGERLSRPVFFIAKRAVFDPPYWAAWVKSITAPAPFPSWMEATQTQAGLASLHNLKQFLLPLHLSVTESGDTQIQRALAGPLLEALKGLP